MKILHICYIGLLLPELSEIFEQSLTIYDVFTLLLLEIVSDLDN